ncbi:allophanate hydrolase [Amorphus orientalis]|uniref:Allophanate hydrolase n=1 Tax=Amorphus orientalis TaxID=649198 RepID=A0AAE4AQX1_9HYPH|nr:allophanate hydrolase [Amorphus orientalis]MDQ0314561.1 allophanate hydrolase [Amorphus orientalis]
MIETLPFTLGTLRDAYRTGLRPEAVVAEVFRRLEAVGDDGIFIHIAREAALAEAARLGDDDGRPLWGIPFAVKDNIDVAGMPTTAACPDFAYTPDRDAFVVDRLRAAGAICVGKTNLDQFATGLVGVRTPYPAPKNALDPAIVPGGSSSGSAVVVAHNIVPFALGTDTAGSGRVPAALNGIVGLKPTLGALSASGVVPACRTLDTISVFAGTTDDAWEVFAVAAAHDPDDAYARPFPLFREANVPPVLRIGVPDAASLETFGDAVQKDAFQATLTQLEMSGAAIAEIDFTPFYEVARLLYDGAWVAERVAAVGDRLTHAPATLHPTLIDVLSPGLSMTAADTFRDIYRLQELRRRCDDLIAEVDLLCVPSIPTFVSLAEVAAEPVAANSRLGVYTNFVNLLDMCALAVPTAPRSDGRPGSVTLIAGKGADALCAALGKRIASGPAAETHSLASAGTTAADDEIEVAVCGAHMSGLPLNGELTGRGGRYLRRCRTAPAYRFYALAGGPPKRPGLIREERGGTAIEVEVWALPRTAFGDFMAGIPAPLGIGTLELDDGTSVKGFLCESAGLAGAQDISFFGGWRAYMSAIGSGGASVPLPVEAQA